MQAGPLIRQQFGLDRTEWPFRRTLEAQLEQLHTEFLRVPVGEEPKTMPVKKAEFQLRTQPNQVEVFQRSWIGRNLIAFGGTVARQYTIDERPLEVDDQYRKVALITHENGDFTIQQTYYASAKTGAKKDHHRWMKAAAQGDQEIPAYIKVPRKKMEKAAQRIYVDNISLDDFQPLLIVSTRFKPEFKDHASGEYLHAVSLLEMTIQQDTNLVQKPLVEPAPQNRGWFNFGHDSQPEAPAVQFNHLRDEFKDAFNDAVKLQKEHTLLQAAHQALAVAKEAVDQTLAETQQKLEEAEKTVEALNDRLESVINEKTDLERIRDGLEESLEAEQTKTKELTAEKQSLLAELRQEQEANKSLNQTLQATTRDLNAEQAKVQECVKQLEHLDDKNMVLASDITQREATIADLQAEIKLLTEHNAKYKADAEAAAIFAAARVQQLEIQHARAFQDLEVRQTRAFEQQAAVFDQRLNEQRTQHEDRVREKDACINNLREALSASERQAKAERDNLNRKLDALIQAYAALKGAAEGALRTMHTARVQDFAQLQMILNRSGFYDLMHAIKKPFVWTWCKLTRHVPVPPGLPLFAAPDFLTVDPRSVIAEVDKKNFDFSIPNRGQSLTNRFDSLRSSSGSDQDLSDHEGTYRNINEIEDVISVSSSSQKRSDRSRSTPY